MEFGSFDGRDGSDCNGGGLAEIFAIRTHIPLEQYHLTELI